MPTDTERREVARRLRGLPDDSTYPDLIGAIADHDGWYAAADAADRLADLIEPTPNRSEDTPKCDRDALLALADEMDTVAASKETYMVPYWYLDNYAERIREALGVTDG